MTTANLRRWTSTLRRSRFTTCEICDPLHRSPHPKGAKRSKESSPDTWQISDVWHISMCLSSLVAPQNPVCLNLGDWRMELRVVTTSGYRVRSALARRNQEPRFHLIIQQACNTRGSGTCNHQTFADQPPPCSLVCSLHARRWHADVPHRLANSTQSRTAGQCVRGGADLYALSIFSILTHPARPGSCITCQTVSSTYIFLAVTSYFGEAVRISRSRGRRRHTCAT